VVSTDEDLRHRISVALDRTGGEIIESSMASAVDALDVDAVDVVVIGCPRLRSEDLESIQQSCETLPEVRFVVVAPVDARVVRRAFDAGIDGLVRVDQIDECLGAAVQAVCVGQLTLPRHFRAYLGKPVLSTREKQILGMVVMGYTNSQIARTLFVTESTVKSHLSSVFAKLGVRSRNEAAELVLDPESGIGTGILTISGEGVEKV
jgi:DNA-binding NarL/FixJ family response regulator